MHADYWQKCWDNNQAGFHLRCTNPNLPKYWSLPALERGDTVFVPLCGKTVDLLWFVEQGFQVIAVELIETAVLEFFHENNLSYSRQPKGEFIEFNSGDIRILCGDFFKLSASDLENCKGFYDRAALVSWQNEGRLKYAAHLANILPTGCRGLMLVVDYEQAQMQGPPFAVSSLEMLSLFEDTCEVTQVGQRDILCYEPSFRARGVTRMEEHIYQVMKKTDKPL
ncbi:MAG TPA: thiopurine S-methyltransferase [Thiopseudomonas sp.]|nr:thiopurine S-methyltransferase [Thiopseudomonas sp.]